MWVTAIPTELLSSTKKSCGVLERQFYAGLEPTIFGLEIRRLVHQAKGASADGASKAHKLVWHGQRPLMAEGKEKF